MTRGCGDGGSGLRAVDNRRIPLLRTGASRPAEQGTATTLAGALSVSLITIALALVVYLLIALLDPERF